MTSLIMLGAAATGGYYLSKHLLGGVRADKARQNRKQRKSHESYMNSMLPVVDLKDCLFNKDMGAKEARLVQAVRGPAGSIKYVYYLPSTNQQVFSYAPLGRHTAH